MLPPRPPKPPPPEATEAATAAPRRIAGTPTRYEPPLTFLLPASHVRTCRRGQPRIMKVTTAPVDMSWVWMLAFGDHKDRWPTHGYTALREAAMAA
jgi:hypothetical protein